MDRWFTYGDVYTNDGVLIYSQQDEIKAITSLPPVEEPRTTIIDQSGTSDRNNEEHPSAGVFPKGEFEIEEQSTEEFDTPVDGLIACLQWPERAISNLFYRYGKLVGRRAIVFIIIPLLVTAALSCGILFMRVNNDSEAVFFPDNSESLDEKRVFAAIFPPEDMDEKKMFSPMRRVSLGLYGTVIVTAKDGGSILTPEIMKDMLDLDTLIKNFTIKVGDRTLTYEDVCAKVGSECLESNVLLSVISRQPNRINDMDLTFPVLKLPLPQIPGSSFLSKHIEINLGSSLGGVEVTEDGHLKSVKAVLSFFTLGEKNKTNGMAWEDEFLEVMTNTSFDNIDFTYFVSRSPNKELDSSTDESTQRFSTLFMLVMIFAIGSCMMGDWVLTKPWLGNFGVLACVFAVGASFGTLMYCGVEFMMIVATVPFLSLAIGVDDMFVLLSAWRKTDPQLSVEERMGRTLRDGGVSITITTLTDVLGFLVGSVSHYPAVRTFCWYMGLAILYDYIYQITFFAGCMVYTGRREHANRHAYLWCLKVQPKSEARDRSFLYRLFCAGGFSFRNNPDMSPKSIAAEKEASVHKVVVFFRDYYARFLGKLPVKVMSILLFLGYIGVSVYGCMHLQEGMKLSNLALDGSYAIKYFDQSEIYFREYYSHVGVLFDKEIDYSSRTALEDIDRIVHELERTGYFFGSDVAISWIHSFWKYADDNNIPVTKNNFSSVLLKFLQEPPAIAQGFSLDLKFANDDPMEKILASRIYIQSKNMYDSVRERNMMLAARDVTSAPEFASYNITVYSPLFFLYDQYVTITPSTLQNLAIVCASMLAVAFILIPNLIVSLWVFICVVSICTGVIGFMTFWDVNLDAVSMINLITSVGFSVDYTAHIAYSFTKARHRCPNARMAEALGSVGLPIVQGATSTIVGIILMSVSQAYIIRTFFKIMFLVITLATVHALLFLPVLLSLAARLECSGKTVGDDSETCSDKEKRCVSYGDSDGKAKENLVASHRNGSPPKSISNGHSNQNGHSLSARADDQDVSV